MPLMPLASSAARSYIRKKKSLGPFHLSGLATATGLEIKPMFMMDQQGQPQGPAGDCRGNCKRSHSENPLGGARGITVGIRVEIALGIAMEITVRSALGVAK